MGNLVYLFAAYAVFWAVTFAFVFHIAQRQKSLQREIESLKRALETMRVSRLGHTSKQNGA
ncbi:MAG: CcmD family protein [Chloroflexi bacterium]|nr:CcmD family protein [Chloroflexota bacterium]